MATKTGTLLGKKSFDAADEVRTFEKGRLELVTIDGNTIGRATFEPGWRWSASVKPIVQTELCETEHFGPIVSGRMHVVMRDGSEAEFGPGDVMHLQPGHDAWVVGKTPCIAVDFIGFKDYAKQK
jgi:hypothetical protein